MADSGSAVKQFSGEVAQAAGEVAKDVKDQVGEALEQGVQSVVGTPLTPQQIQQKQLNDQKELAEARRKIEFYKKTDQEQQTIRQQEKQKQMQVQQAETQQHQTRKVQQIREQTVKASGQPLREDLARTQAERGKGRGIGG